MKKIFSQGAVVLICGFVVVAATLLLAVAIIALVATAIGNLAFWPFIVTAVFGRLLAPEESVGIGALMLVLIFAGIHFAPNRTEGLISTFAAIWVGGIYTLMFLLLFGAPVFLLLKYLLGGDLPAWTIFPIGLGSMFGIIAISNIGQAAKKRGEEKLS